MELWSALAPAPQCTVARSRFSLSSQNELGAGEATIFGFTSSGSYAHCSKEREPFGAVPNGDEGSPFLVEHGRKLAIWEFLALNWCSLKY